MNDILAAWNGKNVQEAVGEVLTCCGSQAWASEMVAGRPYGSEADLRTAADAVWWSLRRADWLEAFSCHPRIGGVVAGGSGKGALERWSDKEQSQVSLAGDKVLSELALGNAKYAARFGFTYIVCATGKSAEEMLDILNHRLGNDHATEVREAAEQQRQITQIRLSKWLMLDTFQE
ncbi:MAG TPA: 2-oxo-4-hydroxy-4-carboxy-5-ureidoimidazoline decarboxylase [Acidisarcina sp.]